MKHEIEVICLAKYLPMKDLFIISLSRVLEEEK
jgi:hypothetical protein